MSILPPFGDELGPGALCARWLGDNPCGALASVHIIWDLEMNNAPVCSVHDEEARASWVFIGRHAYEPACVADGTSRWDPLSDRCHRPSGVHQGERDAAEFEPRHEGDDSDAPMERNR